jgi:hypothetical protein
MKALITVITCFLVLSGCATSREGKLDDGLLLLDIARMVL